MFLAIGIIHNDLAAVTARFESKDRTIGTLRAAAKYELRRVVSTDLRDLLEIGKVKWQRIIIVESGGKQSSVGGICMVDDWSL